MIKYFLFLFVISLSVNYLYSQRVYKQSRVQNGKIVTDYYYDLPGSPEKGKPYRERGRIKYEPPTSTPYYRTYSPRYSPYSYDGGDVIYEREGRPYRDKSGKIRYEKEYVRYPAPY